MKKFKNVQIAYIAVVIQLIMSLCAVIFDLLILNTIVAVVVWALIGLYVIARVITFYLSFKQPLVLVAWYSSSPVKTRPDSLSVLKWLVMCSNVYMFLHFDYVTTGGFYLLSCISVYFERKKAELAHVTWQELKPLVCNITKLDFNLKRSLWWIDGKEVQCNSQMLLSAFILRFHQNQSVKTGVFESKDDAEFALGVLKQHGWIK